MPVSIRAPQRVASSELAFMPHMTGLDQSILLHHRPTVAPSAFPQFASRAGDEMLIAKLASIPSLLDILTVLPSFTDGTVLLAVPVNPRYCTKVRVGEPLSPSSNATIHCPTYLATATLPFERWRGTIRYLIVFAATQTQSFRVRVTFLPGVNNGLTGPAADSVSTIYDIRGYTEVRFSVPFSFPEETAVSSIGALIVAMYSPLADLGSTTPLSVYAVAYVAGSKDLQVVTPRPHYFGPPPVGFLPSVVPTMDVRATFDADGESLFKGAVSTCLSAAVLPGLVESFSDLLHRPELLWSGVSCSGSSLTVDLTQLAPVPTYTSSFVITGAMAIDTMFPGSGGAINTFNVNAALTIISGDATAVRSRTLFDHLIRNFLWHSGGMRAKFSGTLAAGYCFRVGAAPTPTVWYTQSYGSYQALPSAELDVSTSTTLPCVNETGSGGGAPFLPPIPTTMCTETPLGDAGITAPGNSRVRCEVEFRPQFRVVRPVFWPAVSSQRDHSRVCFGEDFEGDGIPYGISQTARVNNKNIYRSTADDFRFYYAAVLVPSARYMGNSVLDFVLAQDPELFVSLDQYQYVF
jgi:hypothetical protein